MIYRYEIWGSMVSWPVEMHVSKNSVEGTWTMSLNYVDPENLGSEEFCSLEPEDFLELEMEKGFSLAELCQCMVESGDPDMGELAQKIAALPKICTD